MNLRQLEYLVAVVDEGSFTRAAARVRVAQPSLSQQIRALEREIGGPLLERLPREVRLTPAGRAFVGEARAAVRSAERAATAARAVLRVAPAEIEVATLYSLAIGLLPRAITRLSAEHDGVAFRLHEHPSRRVLEASMRSGGGDLAIGPQPSAWAGPIELLGYEEFVLVLPPADRPGPGDSVELATFADRRWVLYEPGHGLAEVVENACARAGFIPVGAVETTQVEAATRLAAAGIGPALAPRNTVPPDLADAFRPIRPRHVRALYAYARGPLSPLAERFSALLREELFAVIPHGGVVLGGT